MALQNTYPYPDGIDFSLFQPTTDPLNLQPRDPLNSAGEHLHNEFSSHAGQARNLWQYDDSTNYSKKYHAWYWNGMFYDL